MRAPRRGLARVWQTFGQAKLPLPAMARAPTLLIACWSVFLQLRQWYANVAVVIGERKWEGLPHSLDR